MGNLSLKGLTEDKNDLLDLFSFPTYILLNLQLKLLLLYYGNSKFINIGFGSMESVIFYPSPTVPVPNRFVCYLTYVP